MPKVKIKNQFNAEEIAKAIREEYSDLAEGLEGVAIQAVQIARIKMPVATGNARDSIEYEKLSESSYRIYSDAEDIEYIDSNDPLVEYIRGKNKTPPPFEAIAEYLNAIGEIPSASLINLSIDDFQYVVNTSYKIGREGIKNPKAFLEAEFEAGRLLDAYLAR